MEPEKNNKEVSNDTVSGTQPEEMNSEKTEQSDSTGEGNASNTQTFAILGYIIPILFFIPLLDEKTKNDPSAKFHANQQLILLILFVVLQFLHSSILMMLSSLGYTIMNLLSLALFALAVFGAYHAYKGHTKELPFIGHFRILK